MGSPCYAHNNRRSPLPNSLWARLLEAQGNLIMAASTGVHMTLSILPYNDIVDSF